MEKPVLILALLGVALTAYLLIVHLAGSGSLFCEAGSSCEIVQDSRWSTLFGMPMALWGLGLYALLALVSVSSPTVAKRWRRLFTLSLIGVLVSVYLTLVAWFTLEAVCWWCMLSLLLITAIFARVLAWQQARSPSGGWPRWLAVHAMVLVPLLALIGAAQAGWLSPPDDPRWEPLAQHLQDTGAKFYGSFWCPECQKQKKAFGRAADALPYVECSPNGRNGPMGFECTRQGIEKLPTWIIRGQRHEGILAPSDLARHSRFHQWNRDAAAGPGAPSTAPAP